MSLFSFITNINEFFYNKLNGEELVSTHTNYHRHIAVLSKSVGDMQFSYLYQRLLDHLLQKTSIEYYA